MISLKANLVTGAVITGFMMPLPAVANDASQPSDSAQVQAKEDGPGGDNEGIVVTARRRAERLQDVPVAAQTISGQELQVQNITTIANLRVLAPNVSFDKYSSGSGSSLSIRGVSSSPLDAGIEQSVLVNIDGMPMSRGRILSDAMFDIEAVEILKGPQALFFGKNSPAGVVSLRSANPTSTLEGFVRTSYEFTNDQAEIEGAISGPIAGDLTGRIAVSGSSAKGFMRNRNVGIADPYRTAATGGTFIPSAGRRLGEEQKIAGRGTLQYKVPGFSANLKVMYSAVDNDGFQSMIETMGCGGGRSRPVLIGFQDPNGDCQLDNRGSRGHLSPTILAAWPESDFSLNGPKGRSRTFLPILTLDADIAPGISVTSTTAYYRYNVESAGSTGENAATFFFFYNTDRLKDVVQELRLNTDLGGFIDFSAGAFFSNSNRRYTVGAITAIFSADPVTGKFNNYDARYDAHTRTYSAFGQVRIKPVESVELAAGGRYTHDSKDLVAQNLFAHASNLAAFRPVGNPLVLNRDESNFSPEITATWHMSRELMIYGAYKTGYLGGGFSNNAGISSTASRATIEFDAEKAKGGEIGLKVETDDRTLRGSLVAYHYKYTGLQLTALNATTAIFQTQNAASTIVKGIEADFTFRPVPGLSLRGSAAYNHARFQDFPGAQCYAGQTAALGCVAGNQDLSGRPIYRAPRWSGFAGIQYETQTAGFDLRIGADAQYTSQYYTTVGLNPVGLQSAYWLFNANVGIGRSDSGWRLSLIGKNLFNRHYATLANDSPGGAGDVAGIKGDPRTVAMQLQFDF